MISDSDVNKTCSAKLFHHQEPSKSAEFHIRGAYKDEAFSSLPFIRMFYEAEKRMLVYPYEGNNPPLLGLHYTIG